MSEPASEVSWVLATANPGKVLELRTLLGSRGKECPSAAALGVELPEETGGSYVQNAELKAIAVVRATGRTALGDDTGLAVDALGGAPGIHTAGYAAEHGGWDGAATALARQVGLLTGASPVAAELHCALVLAEPNGVVHRAHAAVRGRLRWPPTSAPGFAAIFEPDGVEPLLRDGVLLHRRRAYERLLALINGLAPAQSR